MEIISGERMVIATIHRACITAAEYDIIKKRFPETSVIPYTFRPTSDADLIRYCRDNHASAIVITDEQIVNVRLLKEIGVATWIVTSDGVEEVVEFVMTKKPL